MSLKRKFFISSILMFFIPILLIALVAIGVLAASMFADPTMIGDLIEIDPGVSQQELKPGGALFTTILILGIASTAIVAGTCAIVVLTLSRAVLTPLGELKKAAENIRDGNLDFEVLHSDLNEVNALCFAFDDMRIRLKKSVMDREAYEKERYQLIANISHDLRTPITSIKGYVEGMLDGVANTPEMRDRYLHTIYTKASSMERLVEQMSDFSELELGRMKFHYEACGAVGLLRGIMGEFRTDMEAADATLLEDYPDTERIVWIDREKIRRVFLNLLSNTIKYRSERPLEVRVSVRVEDKGIYITVKDNGRGIAKQDINRVFEGFYRGDPARTGSARGHGLGLSIAKQIVETHRGKIWIKSEETIGTEVNLYLPSRETGGHHENSDH